MNDETLGNSKTVYLESNNIEFVKKVIKMDDCQELVKFLDKYKSLYTEHLKPLDSYDYSHDITQYTNNFLNDISIPFTAKIN